MEGDGLKSAPHSVRSTPMIPKDEIETFRSPSEYVQWFKSHLETIGRDRTYREEALQHKGFWKKFYEELFPLYSLLNHKQAEWIESRLRNVIGDQSYDVEIQSNTLTHLEIGTTEFDYVEVFRMREFSDKGYVSVLGKPKRNRKNRLVAIEDEARPHDNIVQERIESIVTLIESKSAKKYPAATGLVVYYDDSSIMFDEVDNEAIRSRVDGLRPKWESTFDVVYLVGPRGDQLIEVKK